VNAEIIDNVCARLRRTRPTAKMLLLATVKRDGSRGFHKGERMSAWHLLVRSKIAVGGADG